MPEHNLSRFIEAQERDYRRALSEIQFGRKTTHWMWYIFPQVKGLGHSSTSEFYGIDGIDEAKAYLENDYLRSNLLEISKTLLQLEVDNVLAVFDRPDDLKLKSSMTLFAAVSEDETVFKQVLDKFFDGKQDFRTLKKLGLADERE